MKWTPFMRGRSSGSLYAIDHPNATLGMARSGATRMVEDMQRLYGEYQSEYEASQFKRGFTAGFNVQRKKQESYSKGE